MVSSALEIFDMVTTPITNKIGTAGRYGVEQKCLPGKVFRGYFNFVQLFLHDDAVELCGYFLLGVRNCTSPFRLGWGIWPHSAGSINFSILRRSLWKMFKKIKLYKKISRNIRKIRFGSRHLKKRIVHSLCCMSYEYCVWVFVHCTLEYIQVYFGQSGKLWTYF